VPRLRVDELPDRRVLPERLRDPDRVRVQDQRDDEPEAPHEDLDAPLVPSGQAIHPVVEPSFRGGTERGDVAVGANPRAQEGVLDRAIWQALDELFGVVGRMRDDLPAGGSLALGGLQPRCANVEKCGDRMFARDVRRQLPIPRQPVHRRM